MWFSRKYSVYIAHPIFLPKMMKSVNYIKVNMVLVVYSQTEATIVNDCETVCELQGKEVGNRHSSENAIFN